MAKILREAHQAPVVDVAKRHGISAAPIYGWRQRLSKLETTDVKQPCWLEQDNAKLKKLVAERVLALEVMKEIIQEKW